MMDGTEPPTQGATDPPALDPPFAIAVRPQGERVIAAPAGELDMATVSELAASLDKLAADGFRTIVLDLREITFMDSQGLALAVRQCAREDVEVSLVDGSEPVRRLFDVAGIRDWLRFVEHDEIAKLP
jgi:anti-anti-sigma factor